MPEIKKIRIRGKLVDKRTGVGLEGKIIRVTDETGTLKADITTGAGGVFSVEFDPGDRTTAKDYSFIISYPGDDYFATQSIGHFVHVPAASEERMEVGGATVQTAQQAGVSTGPPETRPTPSLSLDGVSQVAGTTDILVMGSLTYQNRALTGKVVKVYCNTSYRETTVGADGKFTAKFQGMSPGTYNVQAVFEGDSEYAGTQSSVSRVEVKAARSKATITITKATQSNSNLIVEATLKDENGNPIPKKTLTIEVRGPEIIILQQPTDSNGVVSLTEKVSEGTYQVTVSLRGDSSYEDTSAIASVTIKPLVAEWVLEYVGIVGEKPKAGVNNILNATLRNKGTIKGDVSAKLWIKDIAENGKIISEEFPFWGKNIPPGEAISSSQVLTLPKYIKYGMEWTYLVEVGVEWNGQKKSVLYTVSKSTN